jgi:hypothetical protein
MTCRECCIGPETGLDRIPEARASRRTFEAYTKFDLSTIEFEILQLYPISFATKKTRPASIRLSKLCRGDGRMNGAKRVAVQI